MISVDLGAPLEVERAEIPEDPTRIYLQLASGLWFVDTGYSRTTCDDDFAVNARPSLHFAPGEGKGWVRLGIERLADLALGEHRVRGLRCVVRDLESTSSIPVPVAGVLGMDILGHFELVLEARTVTLRAPDGIDEPQPLRRDTYGRVRLPLDLDGQRIWPVVDTGATGTYLDGDRLDLPLIEEREITWRATGSQGPERRIVAIYGPTEVALAGVAVRPVPIIDREAWFTDPGLLGMNILGQLRVTLDLVHHRAAVEELS